MDKLRMLIRHLPANYINTETTKTTLSLYPRTCPLTAKFFKNLKTEMQAYGFQLSPFCCFDDHVSFFKCTFVNDKDDVIAFAVTTTYWAFHKLTCQVEDLRHIYLPMLDLQDMELAYIRSRLHDILGIY